MSCPLSLSITTMPFRSLQETSNSEWLVSTGSYTWAARSRWASPPRPSDRCKEQATVSDSYLQVVTHELPALAEHHHHALQIAARREKSVGIRFRSTGSYTWAARSRWASPPHPSDRCKEQATVSDSYLQVVTHELPALAEHHHHALQIAARNKQQWVTRIYR